MGVMRDPYLVSLIKDWKEAYQSLRFNGTGGRGVPMSFPVSILASRKRPRMISKNPHADDASMNGDDKLAVV